jgi:hypothetical protein
MNSRTVISTISTVLIILATSIGAFERGPQGVSPGASGRLAGVKSTCPTFTWESVSEAQRHEIVVYRVDPATMDADSLRFTPENEVLYTSISGLASAWTPESSDCFLPGESYVWFIRAVADAETGEGSEWSEPRFFQVAAAPSAEELARAVEVIRRWEAAGGGGSLPLSAATDPVAATVPATAADSGTGSGTASGATRTKSVITGTAAIRGEQPDASGETYGVVGTSASPDGAGIGAANTAGGPDLVLDGAVPAELTEAGVDRPSASAQTFSFSNTGGGGMMLDIDGVEVVTTATDQDTLAALAPCAPGEVAKWTGTEWDCSPDVDTNSDTLAALAPCAIGEVAKWTGSTWECAPDDNTLAGMSCTPGEVAKWTGSSWVCAADEDTTYSIGTGLVLEGGEITLDPAWFSARISILDGPEAVGMYTSIAVGTDGLGLISYYDQTNGDLKVAHCDNVLCTSATISVVDSEGDVGAYTSLAIGADGLGLISYHDVTNGDLKVAHCNDIACSSASIQTWSSPYDIGEHTAITVGSDGLGLFSYYDATNQNLRVAHCENALCSTATHSILDTAGDVGQYTSIVIAGGVGLIFYYDATSGDLKSARCGDLACTAASAVMTTLASTGNVGLYTSAAIGSDGLSYVTYYDASLQDLKIARCNLPQCNSASSWTIDSTGDVGQYTSLAFGTDGLGVIAYFADHGDDLKVAHCENTQCTFASTSIIDSMVPVGHYTSITIGSDGLPLISYYDLVFHHDLKVAHLPYGY